jgi:hypothetical protein
MEINSEYIMSRELLVYLYNSVRDAGIITSANYKSHENTLHLLDLDSSAKRYPRNQEPQIYNDNTIIVEYDPTNIVIVGSSVLKIYNELFFSYYSHYSEMEEYINRTTHDLDIVWWPTVTINDKSLQYKLVKITSPAIASFVDDFLENLKNSITVPEKLLAIRKILGDTHDVYFTFEKTLFEPAGTYNITLLMSYGEKVNYKICDIAVHDGINSQQYDIYGNYISVIKPMSFDPSYVIEKKVYISNNLFTAFNKIHIREKDSNIYLPNAIQYFFQQLLAFNNFIRTSNMKLFTIYGRLQFIVEMLTLIKTQSNVYYTNFLLGFLTEEDDIRMITHTLNYYVRNKIIENYDLLNKLCPTIKNVSMVADAKPLCNTLKSYTIVHPGESLLLYKNNSNTVQSKKVKERRTRKTRRMCRTH